MANFIAKLTSPTNYLFWKICVKSTFTLIIYPNAIFTVKDMLKTSVLF